MKFYSRANRMQMAHGVALQWLARAIWPVRHQRAPKSKRTWAEEFETLAGESLDSYAARKQAEATDAS